MRQDPSKTDAILKDGDTSKTQSKMLSLRRDVKDRSFKDKDVKDNFSKTKTAKMPFQRQRRPFKDKDTKDVSDIFLM